MGNARNSGWALTVLILVTFLLRLGWAATLEAGNDEADNFLFAVYPALSYFDHPPMTMWIARAGMFLCGNRVNLLSIRLGHLLLFAGSTWVLYRLTARWYGGWAGFYAALALNLTFFYGGAIGTFALPDGPFLFFTLLTIWALSEAIVGQPERVLPWLWVGLAWAGALLAKYHAVLLPAGACMFLMITPRARRLLVTPGPYLATAVGLLGFSPVLIWNAEHGWASFVFQGSRALGAQFEWHQPLGLILGPVIFLLPWIWWALVRTVAIRLRGPALSDIDRLLLCLAVFPLAFFLVISLRNVTLVHWPLMGFLPLFCLLGQRWASLAEAEPVQTRRRLAGMATALIVMLLFIVAQARFRVISIPGMDLCSEFSGWDSIGQELQARGLVDPSRFLFTVNHHDSGHLAFAVRNRAPVLCYNKGDARSFAFYSQPEDWVGKDGVLVSLDDDVQFQLVERYFQKIEPVATLQMTHGGAPLHKVYVFHCRHQVAPFPFTYTSPATH